MFLPEQKKEAGFKLKQLKKCLKMIIPFKTSQNYLIVNSDVWVRGGLARPFPTSQVRLVL